MGAVFSTLLVIGAMQRCAAVDDYESGYEDSGYEVTLSYYKGEVLVPSERRLESAKAFPEAGAKKIDVDDPLLCEVELRITQNGDTIPISPFNGIMIIPYINDQQDGIGFSLEKNPHITNFRIEENSYTVFCAANINGKTYYSNRLPIPEPHESLPGDKA